MILEAMGPLFYTRGIQYKESCLALASTIDEPEPSAHKKPLTDPVGERFSSKSLNLSTKTKIRLAVVVAVQENHTLPLKLGEHHHAPDGHRLLCLPLR